ncbi:MAG: phenylalanine--tRNA ligase subunit alpha, partial [Planctomycetes bacterium]|nr:phenylalanine--tRNA ligase subunit alpha [Planctomycetota bacterium]
MLERLESLRQDALSRVADAADAESLRALEKELLGKEGVIAEILAAIPTLPPEERRGTGQGANALKGELLEAIGAKKAALDEALVEALRDGGGFDPTLPPAAPARGGLHPITQVRREVEAIFTSMGYEVLDGPEVELDYYNFQALNVPVDHPSRELQDTFYCDDNHTVVMRTQTSPVQIRAMERLTPPFRVIAPGRVFRNEEQDATHEHTFHQVEGLVVGKDIQVGHLTWTLRRLLNELFERELEVRLRPG